ncbi:hypothetical protein RND71_012762 [Anisodus tanguticus]|uniref:HAT C-terminal dimerisation domain-containing protein n=1 Tax=Anisodus tanguticus TaxID=243964 RepID=A0AAE1SF97_9SOLA|nr:hypothetical protein RND71_012762 [Anisodus tanguticus]
MQGQTFELDEEMCTEDEEREGLQVIINNDKLSEGYLTFARDIEVMEAKTPEDIYKGSIPYQTVVNEEGREDLLKYWRGNAKTFPTLSMMARDVLNIPASSTASERVFSAGRYQIGEHIHSLVGDSLEIAVLFRD